MEKRTFLRLSQRPRLPLLPVRPHLSIRHESTSRKPSPAAYQANPLGDYYESILSHSTSKISSAPPTTASPSNPPITSSSPDSGESESGPSILFSSRLSSPLERRSEILRNSKQIAGVLVPPRPEEPDNCCMSGCVNCVWDRYREEIEEWAAATKTAEKAMRRESGGAVAEAAKSMEDDGGGREGNWDVGSLKAGDDLFESVPVGIREFMAQEKRLKEKHAREGTAAK